MAAPFIETPTPTESTEKDPRRAVHFSSLRVAIVLACAAVIGTVIYFGLRDRGSPAERGTRALVDAFSRRRLIEARLSGGFRASEFNPSREDRSNIKVGRWDQARKLIEDAAATGEPEAILAYGRLLVIDGKPDNASRQLQSAVRSLPDLAEAHNDLGVSLLEQGKIEDAVDHFETALKMSPDSPEALFNRALCYQKLLLSTDAATEFQRFTEVERDPGWLNEAKRRQAEVSEPLAPMVKEGDVNRAFDAAFGAQDLAQARAIADQNLETIIKHAGGHPVRDYLNQSIAGNGEAAQRALSEIEFIAKHVEEALGDGSVTELARYMRDLPEAERSTELQLINAYTAALQMPRAKYHEKLTELERLRKEFASRGNKIWLVRSLVDTAASLYQANRFAESNNLLEQALTISSEHRWPYRETIALLQLGVNYSRIGMDSLAIKYVQRAFGNCNRLLLLRSYAYQYLSNAYENLGNLDNVLTSLQESTKLYLASVPDLSSIASNYQHVASIYRTRGNHALALLFAKQALVFAEQINEYNRGAQVSAFAALEYARLGQPDRAEEYLQRAFDHVGRMAAEARPYSEAIVRTNAAEIALLAKDSAGAISHCSQAQELLKTTEGNSLELVEALRARAEAHSLARDYRNAGQLLQQAVSRIETYRKQIEKGEDRSSFFDAIQGTFDQLITLYIEGVGDTRKAFDFSEQSRARTLLDQISTKSLQVGARPAAGTSTHDVGRPARLAEVQETLPDNLRLLTYAVTRQGTYLFLVTRSGFEVVRSSATAELLGRLISDYLRVIGSSTSSPEEVHERAKELYGHLIESAESKLTDAKALCIIPDKALHFLPFATLVDKSGRYLIESYSLTYAPSASALVQSLKESRAKPRAEDETILAVGNPRFNQAAFPDLDDLADAEREVRGAAAFYSNPVVLTGSEATKDRFNAGLQACSVAHLAMHCLLEEKSPWLAALVLAENNTGMATQGSDTSESRTNGLLYLDEVYDSSLPKTRLVVLSACQSGLGRFYRGEGIVSLVRPFLELRVPTVVASLWSVDSRASADLMVEFHRGRRVEGLGAGEALRRAQIKMARDERYQHPYYWAPFIAIGSDN